jgi:hypothetical protein
MSQPYSKAQRRAFRKISSGDTGSGVTVSDLIASAKEGDIADIRHQVSVGRITPREASERLSDLGS